MHGRAVVGSNFGNSIAQRQFIHTIFGLAA
jgi:hypothetical protein